MAPKTDFFITAIKDLRTIGSVASSSSHLIRDLLKPVHFDTASTIVELGAGDGCITDAIIEQMQPDTKLHVFELNTTFFQKLSRLQDARVHCYNENATELLRFIPPQSTDVIISALPLTFIPKPEKITILKAAQQAIKPQGLFIQYQYSLKDYHHMKAIFKHVHVKFELLNIPPAFIYVCRV
jgi:phospholipid N-methyltransferase